MEIQKLFGEISGIWKIIANSKSKINMTLLEKIWGLIVYIIEDILKC